MYWEIVFENLINKILLILSKNNQFDPSLEDGGVIVDHDLTHCGLMTQYGITYLGQHCFGLWLVAWRYPAITWTNVD